MVLKKFSPDFFDEFLVMCKLLYKVLKIKNKLFSFYYL